MFVGGDDEERYMDKGNQAMSNECPECLSPLIDGRPMAKDTLSGVIYCGAVCHHVAHYGARESLTQGEQAAWERAQEWTRSYYPNDPRIAVWDALAREGFR